jgi:sulfur carrier protein
VSQAPQPAGLSIRVNGEPHTLTPGTTVAGLIEALGLTGRKLAVAIDRDVVPRSRYAARQLADGDRVEILEAVGGG